MGFQGIIDSDTLKNPQALNRLPQTLKAPLHLTAQGCNSWVISKIRGTFLRVPIMRTLVFWGLHWGPLILGNYHLKFIDSRQCLDLASGVLEDQE